ncbi:MAG: hypothetical protein RL007_3072, partial [Bacteroidota bacterium]
GGVVAQTNREEIRIDESETEFVFRGEVLISDQE